ncbi:hemerythrin domain-containing protein [Avibacterium sp. 21-586]|uniref:hemerythrin domain-containing protein n=1 Tax=Avibacterium sp. 21-586 TaxID=2911534 RepID=UPI002245D259|nr:hemerythrin domain-containing protein [Avibacterium sp. 21-586]MCW9709293.1 hemerythrin domain-containing protein [Avibacterium sp. 21-586]
MSLENRMKSAEEKWKDASYSDTISHILSRFHQRHREQLEELIPLAEKVEERHSNLTDCPKGLANALKNTYADLSSHMMKEEQILFPMIQAGNYMMARMPIQVMEFEHDEHNATIEVLRSLTNNMTPPPDACCSWRNLYQGIQEFCDDLQEHIYTENDILFKKVLSE